MPVEPHTEHGGRGAVLAIRLGLLAPQSPQVTCGDSNSVLPALM
jgi:hypothetical protein